MAIASQAAPTTNSSAGSGFTDFDTTFTVSSGSDLWLHVGIIYWSNNAISISSVTWDPTGANESLSSAGTRAANASGGGTLWGELWSLAGPTAGAAKTLRITINSAAGLVILAIIQSFTGVDQTTPVDGYSPATADATSISDTVTSESGDYVICVVGDSEATSNATATNTEDAEVDDTSLVNTGAEQEHADGDTSVTVGFSNFGAATDLVSVAYNVNAAAAGGGRIMSSLAGAGGLAGPGGIAGPGGGLAGA